MPYFDLRHMAKMASGYYSRSLNTAQKNQLTQHIKRLFIQSMMKNLAHHRHSAIIFMPLREHATSREVLLTAQQTTNNKP